jgi:hypothetical protein
VLVPPGVVTLTVANVPVARFGATAVICVALSTVNDVAFVVANLTAVAPRKPVPLMVTLVPFLPVVGDTAVTVGALT